MHLEYTVKLPKNMKSVLQDKDGANLDWIPWLLETNYLSQEIQL